MTIKKSFITIYRRPKANNRLMNQQDWENRENWFVNREEGLTYKSSLGGEEAAEEAFHLTNAPEDCLEEDQKRLLERLEFKGPSLSVGDIVRVEPIVRTSLPEYYLCKSFGWEKFEGDVISLLKHL